MIYGNKIGGSRDTKTYIISMVDENQNEIFEATGVVVDKKEIFDASCVDVMKGRKFASDEGVMTGENDSPCCRIVNGIHEVPPGVEFMLKLKDRDLWDYTTFHAMMWPKLDAENPTPRVDKVVVDDGVYGVSHEEVTEGGEKVNSKEKMSGVYNNDGVKIASIIKDAATESVRFDIGDGNKLMNNTNVSYLVYFSVCKEEII